MQSREHIVSPPPTRRQVILRRIGITLAILGVLATAALIAFLIAVDRALQDSYARSEADEARATATVQTRADEFANALQRLSTAAVPGDAELAATATQHRLEVLHVEPAPDFAVTIEVSERYGHLFGSSSVTACFELTMTDVATPQARVDVQRLDQCPSSDWTSPPTPDAT